MGWDPRHSFAPTRPARRVANARGTGRLDFYIQIYVWPPNSSPAAHTRRTGRLGFYCQILLWPLESAHGLPMHAYRQGSGIAKGTPDIGKNPPHPPVASRTHAVPVVWTSMARILRPNNSGQGPPVHAARQGSGNAGGDPRYWVAPTTPTCRVANARRTGRLDIYGQILLWPLNSAHRPPVHAAWQRTELSGGTPDIDMHPSHPPIASRTHAVPVVWTSMARYFYGHPNPRTDRQ